MVCRDNSDISPVSVSRCPLSISSLLLSCNLISGDETNSVLSDFWYELLFLEVTKWMLPFFLLVHYTIKYLRLNKANMKLKTILSSFFFQRHLPHQNKYKKKTDFYCYSNKKVFRFSCINLLLHSSCKNKMNIVYSVKIFR